MLGFCLNLVSYGQVADRRGLHFFFVWVTGMIERGLLNYSFHLLVLGKLDLHVLELVLFLLVFLQLSRLSYILLNLLRPRWLNRSAFSAKGYITILAFFVRDSCDS